SAGPLADPAAAEAMFLKVGDAADKRPTLVFVAGALGWYPDRPHETNHIGQPQLALSKLGMDLSLWDEIRVSKDHGLGTADREGFYQLLSVLGKVEPPLITRHAPLNVV